MRLSDKLILADLERVKQTYVYVECLYFKAHNVTVKLHFRGKPAGKMSMYKKQKYI